MTFFFKVQSICTQENIIGTRTAGSLMSFSKAGPVFLFFSSNLGIGIERDSKRLPFSCFSCGNRRYSRISVFLPPSPPALQIYEESKMNLEQERPFVCSAPGCSQVSVGINCLTRHTPPFQQGSNCPRAIMPACCRLSFSTKILSKSP